MGIEECPVGTGPAVSVFGDNSFYRQSWGRRAGGPWGQYSGKIRFIDKPGVQEKWGRHVAKRSSDPRVP